MKNKEKKGQVKTSTIVYYIILATIGVAALVLVFAWDSIFHRKQDQIYGGASGFEAFKGWLDKYYPALIFTVVAIIIVVVICTLISLFTRGAKLKSKKAATFISLILSLIKWSVIVVALFLVLVRWGVDTEKILASIGIITLIIGLGCQTLISDIVAGIFLVADNAFEVGDIVVVDDFRGTVIEIGLKSTKIEDAGGNVKVVSNSAIHSLVNLTNSLSLAIVEISIPYEENLARTETLLIERLKDMDKRIPSIVEGPYYKGVEDMGDSAVILKVIAKVKEEDRFQATRDMKRDIYIFLNENNIVVPYPQVTITQGPNPADHPEWVNKEKEEEKARKEALKQQEASKGTEEINVVK